MKNFKVQNIGMVCSLLMLLFANFQAAAQCPTEDLILTSQAEVDNFANQYPNCTELLSLTLGGFFVDADITNLQGLQNISNINGDLKIEFINNLADLTGLNNLTTIGGDVNVLNNPGLINLNGLQSLTSINGSMTFETNVNLESFDGLNQLQTVGDRVTLKMSDKVTSLSGLGNLTSVGSLNLIYMAGLTSLEGLDNLSNIEEFVSLRWLFNLNSLEPLIDNFNAENGLFIYECDQFTDLTAMQGISALEILELDNNENLVSLNGIENINYSNLRVAASENLVDISALSNLTNINDLFIQNNDKVTSLSLLSNLTTITGNLGIGANTLLTNLDGLNNLTSIGGYFDLGDTDLFFEYAGAASATWVQYDNKLVDLTALGNLTSIGGDFSIRNNETLPSLQGLNNLQSVGGNLYVGRTGSLTSLNGLDALNMIGSLSLDENLALTDISALSSVQGVITDLIIIENKALENIDGLNNINSIADEFEIVDNNLLTDVSGLENLQLVGGPVTIMSNPNLSICNYNYLCNLVSNNLEHLTINQNGPLCSIPQILIGCANNPLTIDCPEHLDLVVPDGANSIVANWPTPSAVTTCTTGTVAVNQISGPTAGADLAAGTYTVAYEIIDGCGNTAICNFGIEVMQFPECGSFSVVDDIITVNGLNQWFNAKLFDANISVVWECSRFGTPCSDTQTITDLPAGNYFLSINSKSTGFNPISCDEWIPITIGGNGGCTDNDGDGICAENDCNDSDAMLPATAGTSCNDNNSNTQNDVYLQDGCTCAGTPISSECSVSAQAFNNGVSSFIEISGLAATFNVKLFDKNFGIAWECAPWNGIPCPPNFTYEVTGNNNQFFLSVQSDNCNEWIPITVPGDLACPDSDNDGVCDDADCAPNDNTLPLAAGTPCDDLNANTTDDVIQADGCTCAGTPAGGGCNVSFVQSGDTQLTISGLSADANTKLFDATGSTIIWECNPWDAGVCSNTEIINLTGSETQYFLAVQSDNCNEWIPINLSSGRNYPIQAKTISDEITSSILINNIFPNPGNREIFMSLESNFDQELTISFYDVVGKLGLQNQFTIEEGNNSIRLNTSTLHTGVYNLIIQNQKGKIITERFVKL